jgi:asparagine synthase (glutamine-hydrolysing)
VCGLAGIVRADARAPVSEDALLRMARVLRHRGPDGFGLALDPGAGLVATRLAVIDIPGGWQPMAGAGGALLAFNGEIFNHVELRAALRGARFDTASDTEVVLRLLEREGAAALARLNGDFALAYWEPGPRRLTLARDRFGVRPLHYAALPDGGLAFASEAKALFAAGAVDPVPDLDGLDETFTLWSPRPPRTCFAGVSQLTPGAVEVWEDGRLRTRRWWAPDADPAAPEAELAELLADSVRLRLRADVPVGTYLSGGLDSSLVTALAQRASDDPLRTFSIAFADPRYDERAQQELVARVLGTEHHVVEAGPADIARAFGDAIWHCETPLVRTAPVPLMLLAAAARAAGITVVATGEGADELFWGYDLFKEVALRELHATAPERAERLVEHLHPHLGDAGRRGTAWRRFLLAGDPRDPVASHLPRIRATGALRALLRDDAQVPPERGLERLRADMPAGLSALERAAALERDILLSTHLLSAQGDRVALAHGVEGRYPFLDHRVAAAARALPPERKLAPDLRDKVALRDLAATLLPAAVAARPKQPYRAPEVAPFFGPDARDWVEEALAPAGLVLFDPDRVAPLLARARAGRANGQRESMAVLAVLSTQLWHARLCRSARQDPETATPKVRIDRTLKDAA